MNQNNNLKKPLESDRDPSLKFRYSRGLGDAIASILHGKAIGWLTKLITGQDKPCTMCSKRADALNILFPIPFWRLFFKTSEELVENLAKDLKEAGYDVSLTNDNKGVSASKAKIKEHSHQKPEEHDNSGKIDRNLNNYRLVTSGDNFAGDLMVRTQIFKRI
jgi:hypothetical protein